WIFRAAPSVIEIIARSPRLGGLRLRRRVDGLPALLPVLDRGLDAVLGEDRAVDLDRRQRQLLDDVRVLDRHHLVDGLALHELGHVARAGDRASAAEGLELGVFDDALVADLELQLHDVAALRRADDAGADVRIVLRERADVPRVRIVVEDLVAVRHVLTSATCFATRAARPRT